MVRTQIQLPDELHERARRFATAREISLAEVTRRGIELFLDRYPAAEPSGASWQLPRVDGGGLKVPLTRLHEIAARDEASETGRR
jgi:hypothetical protein